MLSINGYIRCHMFKVQVAVQTLLTGVTYCNACMHGACNSYPSAADCLGIIRGEKTNAVRFTP